MTFLALLLGATWPIWALGALIAACFKWHWLPGALLLALVFFIATHFH